MIPYGRQSIDEDDIAAVTDALRGDFLTTGPKIEEFEATLCAETKAKHCVVSSNGTTALHLAAIAADLGSGDAAIVPSLTFLATANAPRYQGAEVIFCDVDPETGLMGPDHLEEALSRAKNLNNDLNVKAVFPVHLKGQCVDLKALKEFDLTIIADSCHALGGTYDNNAVGSCAVEDMATFSFHPVKTIAAGEGGATTTNDDDKAAKMRNLRNHGMTKKPEGGPWYYEMEEMGFNYRLTDIQCALGISQMKKLAGFVERRRALAKLYDAQLADLDGVSGPADVPQCNPAWHLYSVRLATPEHKPAIMEYLREKGVGTQVHYIPVHSQPYYKNRYGALDLPGADAYYAATLSLPLFPAMNDDDVTRVVETLKEALDHVC